LSLARGKYQGFNDSPLTDKLRDEENLLVSRETVRRILRAAKLASPQKRRPRKYRSRRPSRPRFGMMALTDASSHDWLQGRGPELTLTGFQDDATHKILAADFQREAENTLGYLRCLRTLITTHGIPLSLYRDRHSIFQRNDAYWTLEEQLAGKQSPTQLGRALEELGIQQIPAYSPQAKGRIERAWRTFQDRLVSELRLAHASTVEHANTVLARFCADYNQRFAKAARDAASDFRSLPRRFDLARCLSLDRSAFLRRNDGQFPVPGATEAPPPTGAERPPENRLCRQGGSLRRLSVEKALHPVDPADGPSSLLRGRTAADAATRHARGPAAATVYGRTSVGHVKVPHLR
jgi:hypothetical protein